MLETESEEAKDVEEDTESEVVNDAELELAVLTLGTEVSIIGMIVTVVEDILALELSKGQSCSRR